MDYSEGDVFKLRRCHGIGVVTRTGSGVVCCHLFVLTTAAHGIAAQQNSFDLDPGNAIAVARMEDSPLQDGRWLIIGSVTPWSRAHWVMPRFGVCWDGIPTASLSRYSDEDAARIEATEIVEPDYAATFPTDVILSFEDVEAIMHQETAGAEDLALNPPSASQDERCDREVRAFINVPTSEDGGTLADSLKSLGWNTSVGAIGADDSAQGIHRIQVVAFKYFPDDLDRLELEMLRSSLEERAEAHHGVLSGWEIET